MALPVKHKITADLHVSGSAARVVALSEAVAFVAKTTNLADAEEILTQRVLDTADRFREWLERDEDAVNSTDEGSQ